MVWSNTGERDRLTVEKGHSLSLALRVEDRLHQDIIGVTDTATFTVRPVSYLVSADDSTAEITLAGVQATTTQGKVFRFDVQASDLNLDPDLDWFYDVTVIRGGYSLSVKSGELVVAANVTNLGVASTFTGGDGVYNLVASIADRNLLNVTNMMPIPEKGDTGKGMFITSSALSETVGSTVVVPAGTIETYGRALQDGDVLFSTLTTGVFAVVDSRTFNGGGIVSVNALTKQVYGLTVLKALLDTIPRAEWINVIGTRWTVPKADVPLPLNYHYHEGDLLFSSASTVGALDTYLVVSRVLETGDELGAYSGSLHPTTLFVESSIVFPMFADAAALQDLFDSKAPISRTINGSNLAADVVLTAETIPDGLTKVTMTAAERTKLASVAANASSNLPNATLLDRGNHTGSQAISTVTGLQASLDLKVESTGVDTIWRGTQASYDQIVTKDPRTLYFIEIG